MWFRDYTLVQQRVQELEREALERATLAALRSDESGTSGAHSRIRAAGAASIRWVGRAALSLSERIDPVCREQDPTGIAGRVAAR